MAKIKINALTILQNSKPITDLNRQDTSIYGTYIFFLISDAIIILLIHEVYPGSIQSYFESIKPTNNVYL